MSDPVPLVSVSNLLMLAGVMDPMTSWLSPINGKTEDCE
jgi:hypothetical protein